MSHAILSPSAAHRWMNCPGSAFLCKDIPNETSVYAEEGTRAHAKAEEIIKSMIRGEYTPSVIEGFPELGVYILYAKQLMEDGYDLFVEARVPLKDVTGEKDAHGTSDLVAVRGGDIKIVDLKWGQGVPVSAEENIQLTIYALGAMDLLSFLGPFETAELVIVQPRVVSALGGIDAWQTTVEHLESRRNRIYADAAIARAQFNGSMPPSFRPGKKTCRWCRAQGVCSAYAKHVSDTVGAQFPIVEEKPVLTPEQRAVIFQQLDDVRAWTEQFEAKLLEDALNGQKFPGLKLVLGRAGARKWKDEQTADDILTGLSVSTEERYKRKLISPTDVEKLYKAGLISDEGWAALKKETVRPDPKPVLAPVSDKREEYTPTDVGTMFDVVK